MDVLEGLGYVYAMSAPAYLWLAGCLVAMR